MKNLIVVTVLLVAMFALVGCSANVVETRSERGTRFERQKDFQYRCFVDDWDYLWLHEKECRLSYWHSRLGPN